MLGVILQVAGAVTISVGLGMWMLPVGIAVAGIFTLLFGIALESK